MKKIGVFILLILALCFGGCAKKTADPKETGVVKFFGFTAGYTEMTEKLAADYLAETGVPIEFEIGGEDYFTVIKTRFASNEGPDIFDIGRSDFAGWGERCADLSGSPWISHVDKTALDAATVDGKILGMPYAFEASGFIYNKDLFAAAGITEMPDTLDELEGVCKKLQAAGITPFGEAWKEWGFLMHIFGTPFAYQGDLKKTGEDLNSGALQLRDLRYINNFFRLFDMTLDYGKGKESIGYSVIDQITDFAQGKMAMIKQGTWLYAPLLGVNPGMNLGLLAVPLTDNSDDTKLMTSATRYLTISNESKNITAAKNFLNYFAEHLQKYMVDALMVGVPYDNVDLSNLGPLYTDTQNYMTLDKAVGTFGNDYWPTGFNVDIQTPLQAYAAGKINREQALEELQKLYDSRKDNSL
jgi:raffinose/stachyose/melibiose transport system substrate-binding protein